MNIAQVKQKCGLEKRENYNNPSLIMPSSLNVLKKEKAIIDALRHFKMIK